MGLIEQEKSLVKRVTMRALLALLWSSCCQLALFCLCVLCVAGWPGPPGVGPTGTAMSTGIPANLSTFRLNSGSVLYVRDDLASLQAGSGNGGLSAGAIAGIAAGGVVAALAAAGAAAFVVRRHRRQRCMPASGSDSAGKTAEEGLAVPSSAPSSPSAWDAVSQQQHLQTPRVSLEMLKAIPVPPSRGASASTAELQRSSASPFAASASEPFNMAAGAPLPTAIGSPFPAVPSPFAATAAPNVLHSTHSVQVAGSATRLHSGSGLKGSACSGSCPSCSPGTSSGAGTEPGSAQALLPELERHVAACDATRRFSTSAALQQSICAAAVAAAGSSGDQPALMEGPTHSMRVLPPVLRDWVVDLKDVRFLRHPDGTLHELGSGARWGGGVVVVVVGRRRG